MRVEISEDGAKRAGVVVVISAGNDRDFFGLGTTGSPATAPESIAVGATANAHVFGDSFAVTSPAGLGRIPYVPSDTIPPTWVRNDQRLVDVGCQAVMPWAAPIGTGKGPVNPYAMRMLRERLNVPLIVDAGLGRPSHACTVMEWGFDAVLLNTAVALAQDPVAMAGAFADATQAGRAAWLSGAMTEQDAAQPSTPVLGTPFWHHA